MSNVILARNFKAEAAIPAFTLVKPGAADGNVLAAAAVGDAIIGVTTDIPAALGERTDVILTGVADVVYGGPVVRGDWLTADALGRAVTAAPAAGANNNVIGRALVSGVLGDVGSVTLACNRIQG